MVRTLPAVTLPPPRALSTSTIPVLCPIDFAWPVLNNERDEVVGLVVEYVFFLVGLVVEYVCTSDGRHELEQTVLKTFCIFLCFFHYHFYSCDFCKDSQ